MPEEIKTSAQSCGPLSKELKLVAKLWKQKLDLNGEVMPSAILISILVPKTVVVGEQPIIEPAHRIIPAGVNLSPKAKDTLRQSWAQLLPLIGQDLEASGDILRARIRQGRSCLSALITCDCDILSIVEPEFQGDSENFYNNELALSELALSAFKEHHCNGNVRRGSIEGETVGERGSGFTGGTTAFSGDPTDSTVQASENEGRWSTRCTTM